MPSLLWPNTLVGGVSDPDALIAHHNTLECSAKSASETPPTAAFGDGMRSMPATIASVIVAHFFL
jgi:hypothetical protein